MGGNLRCDLRRGSYFDAFAKGITKGEKKSEDAGCPDSPTPRYTDVVSGVGRAADPLNTLDEVIDFRKLDLYASLCIERDAGRKSYMARFAEWARGEGRLAHGVR